MCLRLGIIKKQKYAHMWTANSRHQKNEVLSEDDSLKKINENRPADEKVVTKRKFDENDGNDENVENNEIDENDENNVKNTTNLESAPKKMKKNNSFEANRLQIDEACMDVKNDIKFEISLLTRKIGKLCPDDFCKLSGKLIAKIDALQSTFLSFDEK